LLFLSYPHQLVVQCLPPPDNHDHLQKQRLACISDSRYFLLGIVFIGHTLLYWFTITWKLNILSFNVKGISMASSLTFQYCSNGCIYLEQDVPIRLSIILFMKGFKVSVLLVSSHSFIVDFLTPTWMIDNLQIYLASIFLHSVISYLQIFLVNIIPSAKGRRGTL